MADTIDILALGEALVEFLALPINDGEKPIYQQSFGGDTSNMLIAAARQGASTGYISAVGDDQFGRALLDLWADEKVNTDAVDIKTRAPTGMYFVQAHASGRNFSYYRTGSAAAQYTSADLPVQQIIDAKVLHVSAVSQAISVEMRSAVMGAARIAKANNTLVSYDTNLRLNLWSLEDARKSIQEFLPLADFVFPSDDEVEQLNGLTDIDEIGDYFLRYGARLVILKRGKHGSYLITPDQRTAIPAVKANAVDSTGAGDSYAGAFLAYFIETGDLERSGYFAAKVAAGTVSGLGAIDPIPYRNSK